MKTKTNKRDTKFAYAINAPWWDLFSGVFT